MESLKVSEMQTDLVKSRFPLRIVNDISCWVAGQILRNVLIF
jgi:hypothetical protein